MKNVIINILSCMIFLVIQGNTFGQDLWIKRYGGSSVDCPNSICSTEDGGTVVTGSFGSNDGDFKRLNKGQSDVFVIKFDSSGEIVWKKCFGGSKSDFGHDITTTFDGGFLVTGSFESNDGDFRLLNKGKSDIFLIKLTSSGELEWKKTIGGSGWDNGHSVISTHNKGYLLLGYHMSVDNGREDKRLKYSLTKLDSNGHYEWEKEYDTTIDDYPNSQLSQSLDNNFYISLNQISYLSGGRTIPIINILKIDTLGNTIWSKEFRDREVPMYSGGRTVEVSSITNTLDSGCIFTGYFCNDSVDFVGLCKGVNFIYKPHLYSHPLHSPEELKWFQTELEPTKDVFVIKLDKDGNEQWKKCYGGSGVSEIGRSIIKSGNDGYLVTGEFTGSKHKNDFQDLSIKNGDIFVMKLDFNGNILWKKGYGGVHDDDEPIIIETKNGYVLSCTYGVWDPMSSYDNELFNLSTFLLVKMNNQGESIR
jgi:hypothetical protein